MTQSTSSSAQALARTAGFVGLVMIVCGIFAEAAVRGTLIVSDDAAASAANILDNVALFRWGIVSDFVVFSGDVVLALLLYALLRPVNRKLALLAAFFRIVMAAVMALNLLNLIGALTVLTGGDFLGDFDPAQQEALAFLLLKLHGHGYVLGLMIFSGHLLLLGYLLFRARYFPAILGVLIMISGVSYLGIGLVRFVFTDLGEMTAYLLGAAALGEFAFTGWLITMGIRTRRWTEPSGASGASDAGEGSARPTA